MSLQRDASGKIFVTCPMDECKKLHLVKRNRDYKAKEQVRFRCTACKTTWYANAAEKEEIVKAYSEPPKQRRKQQSEPDNRPWMERIFG